MVIFAALSSGSTRNQKGGQEGTALASKFGASDYFLDGGQCWQDQMYGYDPDFAPISLTVVLCSLFLSLHPLPSYLLLHVKGRYSVLMLQDADECCTSDVNLAWWDAT